jgi:hypothetical protein
MHCHRNSVIPALITMPPRCAPLGRSCLLGDRMASKGAKKMSLYTLSRQPLSSDEETQAYWASISDSSTSDRTLAIRASAFVEHQLLDLLLIAMREMNEDEIEKLFFKQNATLATFSARTDIARAFDLITTSQRQNMDIIRHVRNTFAHAIIDIAFSHPLISAECDKLAVIGEGANTPRAKYVYATHELALDLLTKGTSITKAKTKALLDGVPGGLNRPRKYTSALAAFLSET